MRRASAAVLLPALAMSACQVTPAGTPDPAFVLDASVQASISKVLQNYSPKALAVTIAAEREARIKVGRGGTVTFRHHSRAELLSGGLWGAVGTGVGEAHRTRVTTAFRTLSLCGLVGLVGESAPLEVLGAGASGPVTDNFVPFGLRSAWGVPRTHVTMVEVPAELCSPASGQSFSYRTSRMTEWFGQRDATGTREVASAVVWTFDVTCKVAAAAPAIQLGLPVPGDALPVSCETVSTTGTRKDGYAFLRDAGFYLHLSEESAEHVATRRYDVVSVNPAR